MKSTSMHFCAVMLAALALGACSTVGGGHGTGPIDSFAFAGSSNPGLPRDVVGRIIAQGEPELIIAVVPHGVDIHKLIATVQLNTQAIISVITGDNRIVQTNGITANDFTSPVLYSIEIPGEKEPWMYRVVVREADTNARLSQVTLPARAVLQPAFSSVVDQYTIQVPFETKSLSIAALAQSANPQSIAIGGTSTPGHLAVAEVDFSSGQQTTFPITVLAEDGTTRMRYTFVVKRNPPDRDALLGVLYIPDAVFSQPFTPNKFAYSASVSFEVREVVLNAQAQSPYGSVSLTIPGASGGPVALARGASAGNVRVDFPSGGRLPLILTVTAQDGTTQRYNLEILRREANNNNRLSDLVVSDAPLTPQFKPDTLAYMAEVPFSMSRLTIRTLPQDRNAAITIETAQAAGPNASPPPSLRAYPGDPAGVQIDFNEPEMKGLNIVATAQNGETLRYTLLLHRSAPDRTVDLASLTASAGTLAPAVSPKVDTYTLKLPSDATGVQLTATAASAFARVAAEGDLARSQSATIPVDADPGQKVTVRFYVTAEDGTQKLFQVQVSRDLPK
ncbi:MAG: cadherin-like beta sandwich domain-containing protein [Spirochaetia bacterium]